MVLWPLRHIKTRDTTQAFLQKKYKIQDAIYLTPSLSLLIDSFKKINLLKV